MEAGNLQPPQIPDHELLCLIGRGSYGEVWLARNAIGTMRAVKIVHRQSFERTEHFEREFKGLLKFEPISRSHDGLVDILQIGRRDDAGYFFYVMELADDACGEKEKGGEGEREKLPSAPYPPFSTANYAPRTLRSELHARGRLPPADCLTIGLKLAAALEHLHANGLVHRDIKPSNIIFVKGEPKLADIGLVTAIDEAHSLVGTVGYIPPEGPGTRQADLYSLGKVLYEVAFGKDRQDFPRLPPDLQSHPDYAALLELNEIILKACETDPCRRYASAGALGEDLSRLQQGRSVKRRRTVQRRWGFVKKYGFATAAVTLLVAGGWLLSNRFDVAKIQRVDAPSPPAPTPAAIKFIAVLPFDNDSADKGDEFVGGQMAEELSAALAKIPGLRVLGHDSAVRLKGTTNLSTAAQQLKLSAVLRGKVRKSERQLYVSAQLLRPADDSLLWSQVYDRELREIFGIQTDIAEKLAEKLKLNVSDTVRDNLATKATKNFEAYQSYLEGRALLNRGEPVRALASFQEASRLDANFALAYAGLSDVYSAAGAWWALSLPREVIRSNALALAEKAVSLDDRSAEAHTALATARYHLYDWGGAEKEFQRAIKQNPNYAYGHRPHGKLLCALRRFDEAIAANQLAKELDPWSLRIRNSLGWTFFDGGQYEQAQKEFEELLKLDENFGNGWGGLGWCYEVKGKHDDAIAAWEKDQRLSGEAPEKIAELAQAYKSGGMRGYRQKDLDRMLEQANQGGAGSLWIAVAYAEIGETNQAFAWLERAYEDRHPGMPLVGVEYRLDGLHSDPRFAALLKKMGLPNPQPAAATPVEVRFVAVLPFDNESPDQADKHLGLSIADELSSALAKIPELRVLGRDSSAVLKSTKDRRAAAQQLKVGTLLVGHLRKSANQLRLTAQLINADDTALLWSEVYDRDMREIFGIQTDIAEKVADRLNVKLTDTVRQRLALKPTKNLEAFQLYLEGRYFWNRRPNMDATRAKQSFQQAIEKDPDYAAAYSGLADSYPHSDRASSGWSYLSWTQTWSTAKLNAGKAVALDDNLSEAHASLAYVRENFDWDWTGAGTEFRRALELDPNNVTARSWYAIHLGRLGQYEPAIQEARRAQELDPLSPMRSRVLAWMLLASRKHDEAIYEFEKSLQLGPGRQARYSGWDSCYFYRGKYEEALDAFEKGAQASGLVPQKLLLRYEALRQAYRTSGSNGYWQKELELTKAEWQEPGDATELAIRYAWLGDQEQTLAWLEKASAERAFGLINLNLIPVYDLVRADPRYQAVLKKMGLPEPVWKQ